MGREEELKRWLVEARDRYLAQKHLVENLERRPDESAEHFAERRAHEKEQLANREKIKNHLAKKLKALQETKEDQVDPDQDDLATFDGRVVASWMVGDNPQKKNWLGLSRKAGWTGTVVSGYRTPEYSESLCYAMCGHPSCPGTCAGRSSNHSGKTYPAGAIDVSDYTNFGEIQKRIGSPLINDLPIDKVHYSVSGH